MPNDDVAIEVNGREAAQAEVSLLEHEGWGHFTAMQVRGGRTRGLDLHLARLEAAHRDVYERALASRGGRARIRHALARRLDASVRVYGYWAGLIVTVREPYDMPRRLRPPDRGDTTHPGHRLSPARLNRWQAAPARR